MLLLRWAHLSAELNQAVTIHWQHPPIIVSDVLVVPVQTLYGHHFWIRICQFTSGRLQIVAGCALRPPCLV